VSELRWILLATGLVVLAAVFYLSRSAGSNVPRWQKFFKAPRTAAESADAAGPAAAPSVAIEPARVERIIAVRLMARDRGGFPGEPLVVALREAGLRHGQFGIFHRHTSAGDREIAFSVASLVEPGSFDLSQLKNRRYPGISLFLTLPGDGDRVAAFDDMLSIGRTLAAGLDGELLDEQGSRLSVQRERFLREEVIQFRAAATAP
jgi:cell division protein ZipA